MQVNQLKSLIMRLAFQLSILSNSQLMTETAGAQINKHYFSHNSKTSLLYHQVTYLDIYKLEIILQKTQTGILLKDNQPIWKPIL